MLTNYRITKYNPQKRDSQGAYLDFEEWTSISDVGKATALFLTYEAYEEIENAYVAAVKTVLKEKNRFALNTSDVELHHVESDFRTFEIDGRLASLSVDFSKEIVDIRDGVTLSGSELDKFIRLILREVIWMKLFNDVMVVTFGYDYYMYVECEELQAITIAEIEKSGLYVEAFAIPIND